MDTKFKLIKGGGGSSNGPDQNPKSSFFSKLFPREILSCENVNPELISQLILADDLLAKLDDKITRYEKNTDLLLGKIIVEMKRAYGELSRGKRAAERGKEPLPALDKACKTAEGLLGQLRDYHVGVIRKSKGD